LKYAIFSDMHGNLPAFEAALADAKKQGAEKFLLLGDLCSPFPWANEIAETIRSMDFAHVIRGNGEGYLINLLGQNQADWTYEQFKPLYWSFRALTAENLKYLTNLPETFDIADGGENIRLAHSLNIFFRSPKIKPFHSSYFRILMEKKPFSHEEYLAFAKKALLSRPDALEQIRLLPKGVYLFGHNHMQFHMEHEGKIFVNPGSCGSACDCLTGAAYTLLEHTGDSWAVTERRVEYDIQLAAGALRNSGLAAEAPVWAKIIEGQLMSGKDCFGEFVGHLIETGQKLGKTEYPVGNDVWEAAVKSWEF